MNKQYAKLDWFIIGLIVKKENFHFPRWALNFHGDLSVSLDWQGLPPTAASAKANPRMLAATAPTVLLGSVPVQMELLCGAEIPAAVGPMPVLASSDPEATREAVLRNPEVFATSLQQSLAWHLLELEYVDLSAANSFCKRGSREGKVQRPFHVERATNLELEAAKRQFFQASTASSDHSTGRNKSLSLVSHYEKFPAENPSWFSNFINCTIKKKFSYGEGHDLLVRNAQKRFAQSLSVRSWKRYESTWTSFVNFSNKIPFEWPIPLKGLGHRDIFYMYG